MKKGINGEQRRKEEEYIRCDRCSLWATSRIGEAEGTQCCQKCEGIAYLRILIIWWKEEQMDK